VSRGTSRKKTSTGAELIGSPQVRLEHHRKINYSVPSVGAVGDFTQEDARTVRTAL
jgi:hypothetical protein